MVSEIYTHLIELSHWLFHLYENSSNLYKETTWCFLLNSYLASLSKRSGHPKVNLFFQAFFFFLYQHREVKITFFLRWSWIFFRERRHSQRTPYEHIYFEARQRVHLNLHHSTQTYVFYNLYSYISCLPAVMSNSSPSQDFWHT